MNSNKSVCSAWPSTGLSCMYQKQPRDVMYFEMPLSFETLSQGTGPKFGVKQEFSLQIPVPVVDFDGHSAREPWGCDKIPT